MVKRIIEKKFLVGLILALLIIAFVANCWSLWVQGDGSWIHSPFRIIVTFFLVGVALMVLAFYITQEYIFKIFTEETEDNEKKSLLVQVQIAVTSTVGLILSIGIAIMGIIYNLPSPKEKNETSNQSQQVLYLDVKDTRLSGSLQIPVVLKLTTGEKKIFSEPAKQE